jgi:DNA polymerase-1
MSFPSIKDPDTIAFDTETTGLSPLKNEVFGVCIATGPDDGWYWDVREHPLIWEWLEDLFHSTNCPIVCHNANFDMRFLDRTVKVTPFIEQVYDTMILARCLNENLMSYSLDSLCERWLGERKVDDIYPKLAKIFGGRATRNVQMPNLHKAPSELVAPYGIKDAVLTWRLFDFITGVLDERPELKSIVEFEREAFPSFFFVEKAGIPVNIATTKEAQGKVAEKLEDTLSDIKSLVGFDLNVNSGPAVKKQYDILDAEEGAPAPFKIMVGDSPCYIPATGKGKPSIAGETLHYMADSGDKLAQLIIDARSLIKTKDTFLGGHILGHHHDSAVYPRIFQWGTSTGRVAYRDPAMQQIPSRNKSVSEIVKSCFEPDPGQVWLDCDLASFEVRVFAHLIGDESIRETYCQNPLTDFHQTVANMTGLVRNATYSGQPNAKQLNLSMIFNSGNGAIAEKMGMPWKWEEFEEQETGKIIRYKKAGPEAMAVINNYHEKLPGVKKLANDCKTEVINDGFITTHYGRKIRFPDRSFAYKASGLKIQATAADINKRIFVIMEHNARAYGGRLLLNTHDSYSISIPAKHIRQFWRRTQKDIDREFDWFTIPLILELSGVGDNWWLALQNQYNMEL